MTAGGGAGVRPGVTWSGICVLLSSRLSLPASPPFCSFCLSVIGRRVYSKRPFRSARAFLNIRSSSSSKSRFLRDLESTFLQKFAQLIFTLRGNRFLWMPATQINKLLRKNSQRISIKTVQSKRSTSQHIRHRSLHNLSFDNWARAVTPLCPRPFTLHIVSLFRRLGQAVHRSRMQPLGPGTDPTSSCKLLMVNGL
jgi:hypothetical protein